MRVFCRIKPLPVSENHRLSAAENKICLNVQQRGEEVNIVEFQGAKGKKTFHFDAVFSPGALQSDVFEQVKPFIQSALNGENVCVFAYGQTGAGKTFTMEGPNTELLFDSDYSLSELSGILPRTAEFMLAEI